MRSIIENFGCSVSLEYVGMPSQFLDMIETCEEDIDCVIISAHGDDHGIVFGTYADGVDVSMLHEGSLPATALSQQSANLERVHKKWEPVFVKKHAITIN